MRKNVTIAALLAAVLALVWSDVIIRTGADGWCAWWRSNVKVCSHGVDVDRAEPRYDEIATVYFTNVKPQTRMGR